MCVSYGLHNQLVTDNGGQFTSQEFAHKFNRSMKVSEKEGRSVEIVYPIFYTLLLPSY